VVGSALRTTQFSFLHELILIISLHFISSSTGLLDLPLQICRSKPPSAGLPKEEKKSLAGVTLSSERSILLSDLSERDTERERERRRESRQPTLRVVEFLKTL